MPMLELVAENGSDGLETMTPPSMGGNSDLAEAKRRVGDKLFFIGGFDQNAGFEQGNPQLIREMVFKLHSACPDGGYICAPSDQFFKGSIENLRAFADACRECVY
jgi:uroporphyrinogen decarboxylase